MEKSAEVMDDMEIGLDRKIPAHLWRKIFGFIPRKLRDGIPLTCSTFYGIICNSDKFRHELFIDDSNLYDHGLLRSQRKFKRIVCEITSLSNNFERMCTILQRFGSKCEELWMRSVAGMNINAARLILLLQCVPKLRHLSLDIRHAIFIDWRGHDETVLPYLEKLTLCRVHPRYNFCANFAAMFTPNTIQTLEINGKWNHLDFFLQRQSNIKRLKMPDYIIESPTACNHLKLESVEFHHGLMHEMPDGAPTLILTGQGDSLKAFNRFGHRKLYPTSRNMMRAILARKSLECLHFSVGPESWADVHGLAQMPKLKDLFIEPQDFEAELSELANVRLAHLERFCIEGPVSDNGVIDRDFLEAAGLNWPRIKHFKLMNYNAERNGIETLNDVLDNFPLLESLELAYGSEEDMEFEESHFNFEFFLGFQLYPRLKVLKLKRMDVINFRDMLTALPNLERIKIKKLKRDIAYSPALLNQLLKMKSLHQLKLPLCIESSSYLFGEVDAKLMKDLCRRLQVFKIIIKSPAAFATSLRDRLQNCDHFIDLAIEHAEGSSISTLTHARDFDSDIGYPNIR